MTPETLLKNWNREKAARQEAERRLAEQEKLLAEQQTRLAEHKKALAEKEARIERLEAQMHAMARHLYGQRSEKMPESDPNQLDLFGEQPEATPEEIKEETSKPKRPRKRAARKPIPKDLPREEIVHDLSEEEKTCACCGKVMAKMGEDATEKLEIVPPRLYVKRHVRPRYACGSCKDKVAQAPGPEFALPRANAGASMLAYLIVGKYADHLPLCRMERIFKRYDIDMPRARMCDWLMTASELVRPLVRLMFELALGRSEVLGIDETPLRMQIWGAPGRKTKRCYLWAYRGDGFAPYTLFEFLESRSRAGPEKRLFGYTGYLQSDDYGVYTSLEKDSKMSFTPVRCWAHARRKFFEAAKGGSADAERALELIGRLYDVEKEARTRMDAEKDFGNEELRTLRQEKSVPALGELREWLETKLLAVPKSPLGQAIGYTLDNWEALCIYTTDGAIPIDNNAVERSIRPVAVGRKNWLFAGSERGGEAAANFFSLIESARRAGLNPFEYLTDVFRRIASCPITRLEELLPDRWQPQNP